jgi:N-acetylglutamate synthase-like GNAT family acetyltransferase
MGLLIEREPSRAGRGSYRVMSRNPKPSIAEAAIIRRLSVDDFSTVRYVHTAAFKAQTAPLLADEEIKAFFTQVTTPGYIDALMAIHAYVACVGGQVVGTGAWTAGDDSGASARISSVFIDPMFSGGGIGRRLMTSVEASAREAGYHRFSVRATSNAVPFFLALGYDIASHGVSSLSVVEGSLPVTFMRKAATAATGQTHAA